MGAPHRACTPIWVSGKTPLKRREVHTGEVLKELAEMCRVVKAKAVGDLFHAQS